MSNNDELLNRNYLCPKYEKCLTRGAKKNLPNLGCRKCRYKHDQIQLTIAEMCPTEPFACYWLLLAVFWPERFESARQASKVEVAHEI